MWHYPHFGDKEIESLRGNDFSPFFAASLLWESHSEAQNETQNAKPAGDTLGIIESGTEKKRYVRFKEKIENLP